MKTSDEFPELSATELKGLLEKDELNVKHEEAACEAIIKWINYNPASRQQYISVLLPEVRFAFMPTEYYGNNVKSNIYIRDNEECKPILINASLAMSNHYVNCPSVFQSPMSRPRLPCAVLFAIGGWRRGRLTNAMESYDARADRWINVTCEEESPRAYHGTAYLNGNVYLIGGFDSVVNCNDVTRFDPVKKAWKQVAPMHSKRCKVSVTILDENIYAMGGNDGHFDLNTAERYEPETNQWSLIAPMNEQRSEASATTLNDRIYICGGFNENECLITAEMYNLDCYDLVVGGSDGINHLTSAEAYNTVDSTWHVVPSMYSPRSSFGIEVIDDRLLVVGGFNGFGTTLNVESYDEKANEWYHVHDMSIDRSALSCCVVPGLINIRDYTDSGDMVTASSSTGLLPV
ncbi:unnamed protein product [Ranitomeya imitator]|uniref:BACK domain-containing protein n=1 Tax=Ranitomeya imitator TaxID=111125 RepID=A0ABN9KUI6_9NEOB|nr:unnamed protein product [Ranitomeya imitator]